MIGIGIGLPTQDGIGVGIANTASTTLQAKSTQNRDGIGIGIANTVSTTLQAKATQMGSGSPIPCLLLHKQRPHSIAPLPPSTRSHNAHTHIRTHAQYWIVIPALCAGGRQSGICLPQPSIQLQLALSVFDMAWKQIRNLFPTNPDLQFGQNKFWFWECYFSFFLYLPFFSNVFLL